MPTKELTYNQYLYLLNRIGYWLVNNDKKFYTRKEYPIHGKKFDLKTIKDSILKQGTYYSHNENIGFFVECSIIDNSKNTSFLPSYVQSKDGKRKYSRVNYIDMVNRVYKFRENNKRDPKAVRAVYEVVEGVVNMSKNNCENPYTSSPHYTSEGAGKLGQVTGYHCGPNSVHQALRKFGITKYSQSSIGKLAGTTSNGTDPDSLASAISYIAKKEKKNLVVQRKYLSDFGKTTDEQFKAIAKLMCKSNVAVFSHIAYEDSGSRKTGVAFGHYEYFDKIDVKAKKIRILNSLGVKSGNGYKGHLQWRSFDLEKYYITNKKNVKSIWIITKK